MGKNIITLQEAWNDGKTVFLYYDAMAGAWKIESSSQSEASIARAEN